jgi:four helix bundle protein
MENKQFGKTMEERTKKLAVSVLQNIKSCSNDYTSIIIKKQLIRSITSIGANFREANHSRSKADFANKIRICESECNESIYWLEILHEIDSKDQNQLPHLISESKELLAIFCSISKSLRERS